MTSGPGAGVPGSIRSGFSMIELLVVIAIVGVLGAMTFPSLSRARGLGRQTACTNHLRQWASAQALFAADNNDSIARESFEPNGVTLNLWAQVRHAMAMDVWYNALPPLIGVRPAVEFAPAIVRGDFYTLNPVFHCPEARFPRRASEDSVAYFSVAMNSKLILEPNHTLGMNAIKRPSSTVMFLDNRLPDETKIDPEQAALEAGQPSAYANRAVAPTSGPCEPLIRRHSRGSPTRP